MNIDVGGYRAAICPQCGGQLNVEQGQKFVKCDFCGTISATADVHYHEHKETHNHYHGNVQFGGQDLETLVKNADTLIRLGDYSAARSIYDMICKSYPQDYRGWWGMILCETKNLADYSRRISILDFYVGNRRFEPSLWRPIKATAPEPILKELERKVQVYYLNCDKHSITNDISSTSYKKNEALQLLETQEKEYENERESSKSSMIWTIIFIVALSILFGFHKVFFGSICLLCAIVGFCFAVSSSGSVEASEKKVNEARAAVNEVNTKLDGLNKQLNEINAKLAKYQ